MKQLVQNETLISPLIIPKKNLLINVLNQLSLGKKWHFRKIHLIVLFFFIRMAIVWAATPPTISSFSPNSGFVGTAVTIMGTNFNAIPANNIVFFGATKAVVTAASSTSLNVTVPSGASYHPITVTDITTGLSAYSSQPFITIFAGSNAFDSYSFAPKADYATGINPYYVSICDLDGDGKPDMAVVNSSSNTVSIYRNTCSGGTISFAAKIDFNTGTTPYNLSIGDMNGDGKPDLIVANNGSNTISILRNTSSIGTISFATKVDYVTGSEPFSVSIGDLDCDGKPDIAVANNASNTVSVLRNTSTSNTVSFATKIDYATGYGPRSVSICDLDGDGKPDIALSSNFNTVSVLLNTSLIGMVSFAAKVDFNTGGRPYSLSIADLDGDGKPDLTTANYMSNTVSVFRNISTIGTLSFADKVDYNTGTSPYSVCIGDLDGDSKPDLAVANSGSTSVSVLRNISISGTLSFATKTDYVTGTSSYGVSISDLDGDGKPDLAVANEYVHTISILRNTVMPVPSVTSFIPTNATAGDTVTITGTNLSGVTSVKFGTSTAYYFAIVSPSTIKAVVGAGGSGNVSVKVPNGSTSFLAGFTYTPPPAPSITSFTPAEAPTGATVIITGTNLCGPATISFGGTSAISYSVVSSTRITALVGPGTTGSISITTPGGTTSMSGFTYLPPPVISSFTPTLAGVGTTITITGTNFTGTTAVSIGGVPAMSFAVISPNCITAVVSVGTNGNISVITPTGTATMGGFTFLPLPTISSFTPASGAAGSTINITGTNFTAVSEVKIGGVPAASYTVNSSISITAVADACTSGDISITTPAGTASKSGFTFLPTFTINSFTPTSGPVGTAVTISGTHFNTAPDNNIVFFGATRAIVTACTSTSLSVVVPSGATYQSISVLDLSTGLSACSAQPFIVTFSGTGIFDTNSFAPKVDFAAKEDPWDVYIADLDGDGKPDLVVMDEYSDTFLIYRNTSINGSISFAPGINFTAGTGPASISIGDLNGDGKPDLAVANCLSNTISVLRNTGTPGTVSFAPKIDYATNIWPSSIAIGDLDNDGKPDIVTGNSNALCVSVLRNTGTHGTISFAPRVDYDTGVGPQSISIADLNGDGKLDIATVCDPINSVTVLRNTSTYGAISFASRVNFGTGDMPESVSIGDLDGDGKPDLVVANSNSSNISILHNTSSSSSVSFAAKIDYAAGNGPVGVGISDLNGDGKPDLAVTNTAVSVLRNTCASGSISFAAKVDYALASNSYRVSIGDLDGDGKSDIVMANKLSHCVSILRNTIMLPPAITSFTPASGATGTTVTISGTNFTEVSAVSFGGIPASSFTVVSPTSIIAVVGSGASGTISVTAPGGTASLTGFVFAPPTITSFSPSSGKPGNVITIIGTNFTGASAVKFGGTSATSYTVNSPTSITAIVGAGSSGSISVTTPGGSVSLAGFTFLPPPVISNFAPTSGTSGTNITITGTNFTGTIAVSIGGTPALSFSILSPTTISAIVGSGSTGVVSVTTPNGTSSLGGFNFINPPVISSVTPTSGSANTLVTINGLNFIGVTSVMFGGTGAISYTAVSPTQITAIVGNGSTGSVTVTAMGGMTSYPLFTYIQTPTISSFDPVAATSGTTVVITGANFTGATAVSFGGTPASSFTVDSPTRIKAIVGSGATGNISVTTPGGTASLDGFIYSVPSAPTIGSFTPLAAPTGANVVITGTNFTGATAVSFGGTPAASFTINSPTTITAVVGTGASGNISVTTPNGTASLAGFMYGASQSITFNALNDQTYGDMDVTLGATASSSLPVLYTSSDTSVAKIILNKVHLVGAGSCAIYANQPGNNVYDAAPQVSQNLKVHPKPITVMGVYASSKVYDGTTTATITGGMLNGVIGSDVVMLIKGTGAFTDKHVGNSKTIVTSGFSITGADADNYTLAAQPLLTGNITAATLSINGVSASNKAYDGTAAVIVSGGSLTGIINPDVVILTKGTGTFTNKNAGNNKTVTTNGYAITGADAGNYKLLAQPSGITANITPIPVSVTGVYAINKIYNGTAAATLAGGSLTGIISPDIVTVKKGTGVFTDKNAGGNKTVVVSGYALDGADAGNYTLTAQPSGITATITPAPLSITGVSVSNKTYDGTTIATLSGGTLNGIISPDVVGLSGGAGVFSDKRPGNNKPVYVSGYTIIGADASNYTLTTQPSGKTADISKAPLSITGVSVSNKTYDGTTTARLTGGTLNGIISPDLVVLNAGTGIFSDKNAGNNKVVFMGGYTISGPDAGNYILTAQPSGITANIEKAPISISGVSASNKVYDGTTTATLTGGQLNGIFGSDAVTITAGTGVFSDKNAGSNKTVMASGYSITGTDVNNYILSAQPSGITANISVSPLTIKADAGQSKNQNTADPVFTYSITNGTLIAEETLTGALSRMSGEIAGRYLLKIGSLTAGSNYKIYFIPDTFNIIPVTGINSISDNQPVVYPNPTSDIIVLDTQEGLATLIDQQGKILNEIILTGKKTIDIRKYPSGVYILILKTNRSTYRYKIIKQ